MKPFDHQSGIMVQVDEAMLYVEQTGDPQGMPLIYLPGGFGSIAEINGLLPFLDARLRLIGIDSRGHGRSTMGDRPLNYAQIQADVLAVMDQLQLAKATLIGYSDGGIVAMRLAASAKSRVNKVVTIGAHWQLPVDDPAREDFKRITPASWRDEFPQTYEEYMRLNPEPDFDRFANAVLAMWLDVDEVTGYPGESVGAIKCPMLITLGEDDPYLSRASMEALHARVAGSKLLIVPDAGHAVHDDHRKVFVSAVNRFLCDA